MLPVKGDIEQYTSETNGWDGITAKWMSLQMVCVSGGELI